MSVTRFRSLIKRRSPYFSPITGLDDTLEGFLSDATVKEMRRYPAGFPEPERTRVHGVIEHNLRTMRDARRLVHVSCWHMNEHESAACGNSIAALAVGLRFSRPSASFATHFVMQRSRGAPRAVLCETRDGVQPSPTRIQLVCASQKISNRLSTQQSEVLQFNNVNAALARLTLRHEGLRPAQQDRDLSLR
jgi:hypothetical protein